MKRHALLIGNGIFGSSLPLLKGTKNDVRQFGNLLRDKKYGHFTKIVELIDEDASEVRHKLARHFRDLVPGDVSLVYYSGHGKLDIDGHLFLATIETDPGLLAGTALDYRSIHTMIRNSRCDNHVVILDCCYSGAAGMSGLGLRGTFGDELAAHSGGFHLLTSTTETSTSREHKVDDGEVMGIFTHKLVSGIKLGLADRDNDGHVTIHELAAYLQSELREQNPQYSGLNSETELIVSKNPNVRPAKLDPALLTGLVSSISELRSAAFESLVSHLESTSAAKEKAAFLKLIELRESDSVEMSQKASNELARRDKRYRELNTPTKNSDQSEKEFNHNRRRTDRFRPFRIAHISTAIAACTVGLLYFLFFRGAPPPELTTPKNKETIISSNVVLKWKTQIESSDHYEIQFESGDKSLIKSAGHDFLRYSGDDLKQLIELRDDECKINWRVRGISPKNRKTRWSNWSNFKLYRDRLERIKRERVVRIGISGTQSEGIFAFFDDATDRWTGLDVELVRGICHYWSESFGVTINSEPIIEKRQWSDLLSLTASDEGQCVDFIISGISSTRERERLYGIKFTEPYLSTTQAVLFLPSTELNSIAELTHSNLRVGAQENTTNFDVAQFLVPGNVEAYSGKGVLDKMFVDLNSGTIKVILADSPYLRKRNRDQGNIYRVLQIREDDYPLNFQGPKSENYAIAVATKEHQLHHHLNLAIKEIKRNRGIKSLEDTFIAQQ